MSADMDDHAGLLPTGTQVRTDSGDWVATTEPSERRWLSASGNRRVSDALMNDWLNSGVARLIAERGRP